MGLKDLITSYAAYNHWANEKMTQWLVTLDTRILYQEVISSFNSIDATMQHMRNAQRFWLAVIAENGQPEMDESFNNDTAAATVSELVEGSGQMVKIISAYSEPDLVKKILFDEELQIRYEFIIHVINHNSYHRGQIITIARGLGIVKSIPNLDYQVFWLYNR